jgi:cyclohexadienyl dehydratase
MFFKMNFLIILFCGMLYIHNVYAIQGNSFILVGTTGDYPPLTYNTESGYQGIDVQIIKDFAKSNKLHIKFIPTTWPSLSKDLSSGKFTIGVGGISANSGRAQFFYLSDAIESSAKVPLIRCSDNNRFTSFATIDTNGVVIVENRGGTNQEFAINHIKSATLILIPQNYQALSRLTESHDPADVMFTDNIEAQYRHQINPRLCIATIPDKFPSSNKVFLFAKTERGKQLYKLFNQWWSLNKIYYDK